MQRFQFAILIAIGVVVILWAASVADHADAPDCQAVTVPASDYFPPADGDDEIGLEC